VQTVQAAPPKETFNGFNDEEPRKSQTGAKATPKIEETFSGFSGFNDNEPSKSTAGAKPTPATVDGGDGDGFGTLGHFDDIMEGGELPNVDRSTFLDFSAGVIKAATAEGYVPHRTLYIQTSPVIPIITMLSCILSLVIISPFVSNVSSDLSFRPNESSDLSFRPNESFDLSFRPNESSDLSFRPNESSDLSFRPNESSDLSFRPMSHPISSGVFCAR
jgi:hypothetical protein